MCPQFDPEVAGATCPCRANVPSPLPLQLLQQATSSSNLGAFSGIQQMAGESRTGAFPFGWPLSESGGGEGFREQGTAAGKRTTESGHQAYWLSGRGVQIRIAAGKSLSCLWHFPRLQEGLRLPAWDTHFFFFQYKRDWLLGNFQQDSCIQGSQND